MIKHFHNFEEVRILSDEDLHELRSIYERCPEELCQQDYNLHYLKKRYLRREDTKSPAILKLNEYMKHPDDLVQHSHYFLRYDPYSWTRMHQDNKGTVTKTIITFIETSEDLVGGHTLVFDRHYDLPPKEGHVIKRTNSVHKYDCIPVVASHKEGASVVYSWNVSHGVSLVRQGYRIVLVSWYTKP